MAETRHHDPIDRLEGLAGGTGLALRLPLMLLPPHRRRGILALYAFAQAVDDAADDPTLSPAERAAAVAAWRAEAERLPGGQPETAEGRALAPELARFGAPAGRVVDMIDAQALDAAAAPHVCADEAALDVYLEGGGAAVADLVLAKLGADDAAARAYCAPVAAALKLTHMVRDLEEDARFGRLYPPATWWADAGVEIGAPTDVLADPNTRQVVGRVLEAARGRLNAADAAWRAAWRPSLLPVSVAAGLYRRLIDRLAGDWRV